MTGETGTTITRMDIITITGLTLSDGSILESGAVLKIATEFPIGYSGFRFDIQPYRSLEIFKAGYKPVEIMNFETRGEYDLGNNFSELNMVGLYHIVNSFINSQFSETISEVVMYEEEI